MTLDDALIDEHSRHVLLAEVGVTGLTRLLGAAVRIRGAGAHRTLLAEMLRRSGLTPQDAAGDATVVLGMAAPTDAASGPTIVAWGTDDRLHVLLLDAPACPACAAPALPTLPTSPAARHALASLTATVLLLRLVGGPAPSSLTVLELTTGRLSIEEPDLRRCAHGVTVTPGGR